VYVYAYVYVRVHIHTCARARARNLSTYAPIHLEGNPRGGAIFTQCPRMRSNYYSRML